MRSSGWAVAVIGASGTAAFIPAFKLTTMANVMLSLMHKLGMDDLESFGDSTGDFSMSVPASALPDR